MIQYTSRKKGKFKQEEFQQIILVLINKYKDIASDNGERIITTTRSIEVVGGEQILDVEVLLPLKEEILLKNPMNIKSVLQ